MSQLSAVGSLVAVALASAVSGRLLVAVLPLRRLRRCDPFATAASTVVGTMVCMLAALALSSLGLTAPRILLVLLIAHVVLATLVFRLRRARSMRPTGAAAGWAALLAVSMAAALTALLPVLLTGGFGLGYDNYMYCSAGEWLQDHPFSEKAEHSPVAPIAATVGGWQQGIVALGASHALALITAAGANSALVAYPVASAWAFLLGALTVVLAARWALRLSPPWTWGAGLAFALLPHPLLWAQHHGFFAQTYGVPGLLLALAAMGLPPRRGDPTGPVLIGIATAYSLAVYVPFLPLLGAAGAVWLLRLALRPKRRSKEAWQAVVVTLAVFLVAAGRELTQLYRVLPGLVSARVGGTIPMSPAEWLAFAMGTRAYVEGNAFLDLLPSLSLAAGVAAAVLVVAGIVVAAARSSSSALLATLLVLAGLVLWYGCFEADPWSGRRGHTWSVFKAVQWAYPLLLLLQVAGLARARHRLRSGLAAAAISVVLVLSSVQVSWARGFGLTMQQAILIKDPLRDAVRIRNRFRGMPPGRFVLLGRPASISPWLAVYTALLAYPRPVTLDWEDSVPNMGHTAYHADLERLDDPGLVFVATGVEGLSDARVESLGGAYVRLLEPDRPQLAQVIQPRAVTRLRYLEGGQPLFRLGPNRTKLVVIAARQCSARIALARSSSRWPLRAAIQVIPDTAGGPAFRAAVHAAPVGEVMVPAGAPLVFDVSLERGQTTLAISLLGGATTSAHAEIVRVNVRVTETAG